MNKRFVVLLIVSVLVALSGCTGSPGSGSGPTASGDVEIQTATPTDTPTPNVQLSSIGQRTVDDGSAVEVLGAVANYGEASANTTVTIRLLDGEETVAEKSLNVGVLGPDESASFSATFDVDPDRVDGRTITFD